MMGAVFGQIISTQVGCNILSKSPLALSRLGDFSPIMTRGEVNLLSLLLFHTGGQLGIVLIAIFI